MKPSSISRTGIPSQATCNCAFNRSQGMCDHNMFDDVETNNNIYSPDDLDTPSDDFDMSSKTDGHRNSDAESDNSIFTNGQNKTGSTNLSVVYQGEWPINKTYWNGDEENSASTSMEAFMQRDSSSIMSFDSSMTSSCSMVNHSSMVTDQGNSKTDAMIRTTLLSMLQTHDKMEVSEMLLAMTDSPENCIAMMEPGSQCLPLLVQFIHDRNDKQTFLAYRQNIELRSRSCQILHNIVFSQPDDKKGRREARVLRLLEHVRNYCDSLKDTSYEVNDNETGRCTDQQLGPTVAALMKLSFDEEHRHAMCLLGGLQALAELIEIEQEVHGCTGDQYCIMIRRYSGMALTNLTFGDGTNKALLCSMRPFMLALVAQLHSPSEDLKQVSASVLRNLSWRADRTSKKMLREVGAVSTLMNAAMETRKESTLRSILSALWNLSAHCSENKAEICSIDGALGFLVCTLSFKSGSKNLAIIENGGGILRNISSHIAIQNDYRIILRKHNCLQVLLHHLKSPSLTVVSNACGTLWNLSARNAQDQRTLWEMGAVGMLKKLMNSKHKMISMGSSAALKNLLSAMPPADGQFSSLISDYSNGMPSLHVRKQKILKTEIDQNLSETYDNTDSPKSSPTNQPHSRRSSGSHTRHSSLPRHCIPQRVGTRAHSASSCQSDSNVEKATNLFKEHEQQSPVRSVQGNQPSMKYSNIPNKSTISQNKASFSSQRYTNPRSVPCAPNNSIREALPISRKEPVARVSSPSSCSFPAKTEPNLSEQLPVSSQLPSTRSPVYSGRLSHHAQGKKPSGSGGHYNNLAQKMKNIKLEDADYQEQPVNYSLKYSEESAALSSASSHSSSKNSAKSKIPMPKLNNYVDEGNRSSAVASPVTVRDREPVVSHKGLKKPNAYRKESNDMITVYNSYAETDLDQVVDYSRKYQECDAAEECKYVRGFQPPSSQSTFREVPKNSVDATKVTCNSEDTVKVYCTEGTPVNFSSSSSLTDLREIGSVNSQPISHSLKKSYKISPENFDYGTCNVMPRNADERGSYMPAVAELEEKSVKEKIEVSVNMKVPVKDKEAGKSVKFEEEVAVAEETPLMFSRSSSLGSLSSFEQQSIHDDRSSVSDFSRVTSGVVSPSELPDSPGQTMPPSPVRRKSSFSFTPEKINDVSPVQKDRDTSVNEEQRQDDVFDDKKRLFDVEGTPIEFSRATSLSSLSIENDVEHTKASLLKSIPNSIISDDCGIKSTQQQEQHVYLNNLNELQSSNKHPDKGGENALVENCQKSDLQIQYANQLDNCPEEESNHPQPERCADSDVEKTEVKMIPDERKLYDEGPVEESTCRMIEGTPLCFSQNSSLSDLSIESGDEISSAEKALLEECIQLGMPKRREMGNDLKKSKLSNGRTSRSSSLVLGSSGLPPSEKSLNRADAPHKQPKDLRKIPVMSKIPKKFGESCQLGSDREVFLKSKQNNVPNVHDEKYTVSVNSHSESAEDLNELSAADKELLQECIQLGMPKASSNKFSSAKLDICTNKFPVIGSQSNKTCAAAVKNIQSDPPDDSSELLSSEKQLLQECIQLGMPKYRPKLSFAASSRSSSSKMNSSAKKAVVPSSKPVSVQTSIPGEVSHTARQGIYESQDRESSELSVLDKAMLEECISLGMPKGKSIGQTNSRSAEHERSNFGIASKSIPKPSSFRNLKNSNSLDGHETTELSKSDKLLLQECIALGMPKQKIRMPGETTGPQNSVGVPQKRVGDVSNVIGNDKKLDVGNLRKFVKNLPDVDPVNECPRECKGNEDHGYSEHSCLDEPNVSVGRKEENDPSLCTKLSREAQKVTDDMLEAVVDSTDDMTVSTLSCLSDIDSMQPPSVMGELASLSLTNSGFFSEPEQGKVNCSPSLLKKLQLKKICNDVDISGLSMKWTMVGSTGSLNMESSSTSEILENINPPSLLDDMSFTASTSSLNNLHSNAVHSKLEDNSINERLCEAAAMVQMYAKEFSNITGNCAKNIITTEGIGNISACPHVDVLEDVTETACDTIGSDGEFADDLPCDDDELCSETLLAPQLSSLTKDEQGEGSTENLTVTLTEEPFAQNGHCGESDEVIDESTDQYEVLRENADLILSSLKRVHISENSEFGGLPANDMLEDETLSLVSNESDEDSLSPDGVFL